MYTRTINSVEAATPISDPWDWPFLMYLGTTILRRTEKQFWRMTPRKLSALGAAHAFAKGGKKAEEPKEQKVATEGPWKGAKFGYIDQI